MTAVIADEVMLSKCGQWGSLVCHRSAVVEWGRQTSAPTQRMKIGRKEGERARAADKTYNVSGPRMRHKPRMHETQTTHARHVRGRKKNRTKRTRSTPASSASPQYAESTRTRSHPSPCSTCHAGDAIPSVPYTQHHVQSASYSQCRELSALSDMQPAIVSVVPAELLRERDGYASQHVRLAVPRERDNVDMVRVVVDPARRLRERASQSASYGPDDTHISR